MLTPLDEFMAKKANDYMARVDSWRPRTSALKATFDDYKRWASTPNGTYWSGQFAGAAQEAAADDCKGTDNADDTTADIAKLAAATIQYEVVEPLTAGQNLIERVLQHKDKGVSIDQSYHCEYHPAEGESDDSIARNRAHVADIERQIKENVAKWEKGCQTLKTHTDAAREAMLSRINPKAALVDGRKILRDAAAPGDPNATTIDYKKQYPKATDPASTTPAAAGSAETIDYKKQYPKTTVDGHQLGSIGATGGVREGDPAKPGKLAPALADRDVPAFKAMMRETLRHDRVPADQIEQRVNDAVKAAQTPRLVPEAEPMRTPGEVPLHRSPGDQFNDIMGRASDSATKTIDGQIEQAKILTGQAGPGAPGVAEAWKELGLGAARQAHELTTDPLAAPKMGIEEAKEFYNHPGESIGKNIILGTEALGGGAIGGEAAAGARGLLGDLTGAEGRAITHGLDDATPGHHTPVQVEHHTPSGEHGPIGVDSSPASPHAAETFDPNRGQHYTSGDPYRPGDWPPHTPEPTFGKDGADHGWEHVNRGPEKPWMDFQSQITGIERTPEGLIPEYTRIDPETGDKVRYDGPTIRDGQEIYLDAKREYPMLVNQADKPWVASIRDGLVDEVARQVRAMPEGAVVEWHVSNRGSSEVMRQLLDDNGFYDVRVVYTPEAP